MSIKHTPGPWFATKDSAPNEVCRIGRAWNVSTLLPLSDFGHVDADARLIAATPELLEALEDCNAYLTSMVAVYGQMGYSLDNVMPVVMKARAAIAKVTGEQA